MDKNEITQRIMKCIQTFKPIVPEKCCLSDPLTGKSFGFSANEMVWLFMMVEKEFDIHFEAAELQNYGFNSIEKIVQLIQNKI